MENQFSRTELIIGKENVDKLKKSKVIVFGLGGVGSYVVEALARAGIGSLVLIDNDVVSESNINRQLIALHSTIGKPKTEVEKQRVLDINPEIKVETRQEFFSTETEDFFDEDTTYIVDAIDSVPSKIEIIKRAKAKNIPIISSMGTGKKLHPERFEITDISKTSVCPIAKIIRKEMRALRINKLKVLYSKEEPIENSIPEVKTIGSISFGPSVAGLMIAGEVIRDIIK
jgi:tRNA A37 threonylcarbamoyladenosine dehydratase